MDSCDRLGSITAFSALKRPCSSCQICVLVLALLGKEGIRGTAGTGGDVAVGASREADRLRAGVGLGGDAGEPTLGDSNLESGTSSSSSSLTELRVVDAGVEAARRGEGIDLLRAGNLAVGASVGLRSSDIGRGKRAEDLLSCNLFAIAACSLCKAICDSMTWVNFLLADFRPTMELKAESELVSIIRCAKEGLSIHLSNGLCFSSATVLL